MSNPIKDCMRLWLDSLNGLTTSEQDKVIERYILAQTALDEFLLDNLDLETYLDTIEFTGLDMDTNLDTMVSNLERLGII